MYKRSWKLLLKNLNLSLTLGKLISSETKKNITPTFESQNPSHANTFFCQVHRQSGKPKHLWLWDLSLGFFHPPPCLGHPLQHKSATQNVLICCGFGAPHTAKGKSMTHTENLRSWKFLSLFLRQPWNRWSGLRSRSSHHTFQLYKKEIQNYMVGWWSCCCRCDCPCRCCCCCCYRSSYCSRFRCRCRCCCCCCCSSSSSSSRLFFVAGVNNNNNSLLATYPIHCNDADDDDDDDGDNDAGVYGD